MSSLNFNSDVIDSSSKSADGSSLLLTSSTSSALSFQLDSTETVNKECNEKISAGDEALQLKIHYELLISESA